uniref:Uncharacterized protein n=1 Tax=Sipha flava TaxID=143950 RepID=A0A2S2QLR4_9HEMI
MHTLCVRTYRYTYECSHTYICEHAGARANIRTRTHTHRNVYFSVDSTDGEWLLRRPPPPPPPPSPRCRPLPRTTSVLSHCARRLVSELVLSNVCCVWYARIYTVVVVVVAAAAAAVVRTPFSRVT